MSQKLGKNRDILEEGFFVGQWHSEKSGPESVERMECRTGGKATGATPSKIVYFFLKVIQTPKSLFLAIKTQKTILKIYF